MRKNYKRLTYPDRKMIEKLISEGKTPKEISEVVGVHIATIYREFYRGEENGNYSADKAQRALKRGIRVWKTN